jgi:plastocyanin
MAIVVWCACASAQAATVTGKVTVVSSDTRDARKRNDSEVVVWLEQAGRVSRANPPSPKMVIMDQRNKTFIPHVLAIEVGTAVDFPNNDPIDHNAFSNFDGQIFDVHLYAPQMSRRVVFRRTGMVRVFCNIHETMSAVIAVLPTSYFAVTGTDGRFEIAAPPGEYTLRFWHERAMPGELVKTERALKVGDDAFTIPDTPIPVGKAAGVAHQDKYGHDYAAKPPEYIFYPGVRR